MLLHYHAVRVLGASAFDAEVIVAHENTRALVAERGKQDWESEFARMPRLAEGADSVPGLTWPTLTFSDRLTIDLGRRSRGDLVLQYCGRGHTEGDIVAWLPRPRILFAGDLVEAEAALYTGDAFHREWTGGTLDRVAALGAETLVGGRGGVSRGADAVAAAIAQTRGFLDELLAEVGAVHGRGGTLKEAFERRARGPGRRLRPVADLRALPAVRRVPGVGRAVRHRPPGDLDRGAGPGDLGPAAGLMTMTSQPWPHEPVAVLGAGPVGQTTALLLARWGVPTVLLDQRPARDAVGSKAICQQRDVLDVWARRRRRRADRRRGRHLDDRAHLPPRRRAVQLHLRRGRPAGLPAVREHLADPHRADPGRAHRRRAADRPALGPPGRPTSSRTPTG